MAELRRLLLRLYHLIRPGAGDAELDRELSSHLGLLEDEYRRRGLPLEAARLAARRAIGSVALLKDHQREARSIRWLGDLVGDIRYGGRVLRRQPAFFVTAVLSLALGIGANGALFSIADAILLRALPVRHPEQLVTVGDSASGGNVSYPDYLALRTGARTLSDLVAASFMAKLPVAVGNDIDQAGVKQVSGNYFQGLGVESHVGRLFTAEDELAPVAVLSDTYWRQRFDGATSVLGQAITIDSVPFTVVGVAPAGFTGEAPGDTPDVFTSFALRPPDMRNAGGYSWLYLLGRLKPGVTIDQAHAELAGLLVVARPRAPHAETASRLTVAPGARGLSALRDRFADPLYVVLALAATVLLVACTNLAGLLLTRGAARRGEIALRLAIGASRGRVIRQLLTESLLLAALGGVLGLAVAIWGSAALMRLPFGDRPITLDVGPTLRVLAFSGALSVVAGLLFGLAPAWQTVRRNAAISGSSRLTGHMRVGRLRMAFVAVQVALSTLLLAGSVMFVRTLWNLETQDTGFRADHVLLVPIVTQRGYSPVLSTFVPALLERVDAVPDVKSASVAVGGTLSNIGGAQVQVDGRTSKDRVNADWVGPDYVRTAGMTLVAGRDLSLLDDERGQNVVLVNQTLARRFFSGKDAIGRSVLFNKQTYLIVGVVGDAKYSTFRETTPPYLYFSTLQTHAGVGHLEVRTGNVAPLGLAGSIRAIVHELDPHLAGGAVTTLADKVDQKLGREHLVADLAEFFGTLTLILLSIGLYGTLAYTVGQCTKEIGLRLALGAGPTGIVWMVFRQIAGVVVLGLTVGVAGVLGVGRLVKPLLFGLAPTDPSTIVGALMLLVGVTCLAGSLPARRASRLDPASILRE